MLTVNPVAQSRPTVYSMGRTEIHPETVPKADLQKYNKPV